MNILSSSQGRKQSIGHWDLKSLYCWFVFSLLAYDRNVDVSRGGNQEILRMAITNALARDNDSLRGTVSSEVIIPESENKKRNEFRIN